MYEFLKLIGRYYIQGGYQSHLKGGENIIFQPLNIKGLIEIFSYRERETKELK